MRIHPVLICAFALSMLFAGTAQAVPPGAGLPAVPDSRMRLPAPIGDDVLAGIRGGYDLGNGMLASFGISRMVYINGNLVARSSIQIPNLAHLDASQAAALGALVGSVTLVRNGPGNFVDPTTFNRSVGAIVIQNTLDNQKIQTVTTLNATVRNLSQFNSMNLANTLQQALVNSRGQ